MARAARNARRQAARLGLLTALAVGCANIQDPPGGPPDFAPPIILSITPDSGSVVPDFRDDAVIRFDEVISETSGGGVRQLIRLSPRSEELTVSWKRSRLTIKPKGGWRAGAVYHLTLLPGVTDLMNNRLDTARTVIFSTGGPIPDTRVSGTVINWEEGRAAVGALIEAILLPDSLAYVARADSVGDFQLTAVPLGEYLLVATVDQNNDGLRTGREAFDSVRVALDSTFSAVLWTFAHDTVGPRMTTATIDSLTVRATFTQKLAPGPPDSAAAEVFLLPDTVAQAIANLWTVAAYDSVSAAAAAARAAARADSLAAADTAATPDSLPPVRLPPRPDIAPVDTATAAASDTSRATRLLGQRPKLYDALVIRLAAPLTPGGRYLVAVRATNVNGVVSDARSVLVVPAASDST